jgi:hypothetical protein
MERQASDEITGGRCPLVECHPGEKRAHLCPQLPLAACHSGRTHGV